VTSPLSDLSGPTRLYLALYLVTLLLHLASAGFVLGGQLLVAASVLRRRRAGAPSGLGPADFVRDWLPLALGVAITLGVAPLLFIQILYSEEFYSANLLLSHRWMAIVPVLIVGFYALYLQKSRWLATRPWSWQLGVSLGAAGCFAFTALSWTENHLLSLDRAAWAELYASGAWIYHDERILPRLALWICGALAITAWLSALGLHAVAGRRVAVEAASWRRLALLGLAALACAAAAAGWLALAGAADGPQWSDPALRPWLAVAAAGAVLQAIGWSAMLMGRSRRLALSLAGVGLAAALSGVLLLRELERLARVDLTALSAQHAQAMQRGGLWVFGLFLVVNGLAVGWVIRRAVLASRTAA